ncbi:MAG: sugar phosphate isomerase/epimerase [Fimbriimonadales bacterium]
MPRIGLQLYTLRDDIARDFEGVVRAVARMGYEAIEHGGGFGAPPESLQSLLQETGLSVAGLGYSLEDVETRLSEAVDYLHALNTQYAITFWIDESQRRTADDWYRLAERFQRAGEALAQHGIHYLYHLHGYEFSPVDGDRRGVDILMENTQPDAFNLEPDTYWVEYGGADAVAFCTQYAHRIRCVHLKDYVSKPDMHDVEIGEGAIDMKAIVRLAFQHDWDWLIVEQERYFRTPLESAERCYQNLKRIVAEVQAG